MIKWHQTKMSDIYIVWTKIHEAAHWFPKLPAPHADGGWSSYSQPRSSLAAGAHAFGIIGRRDPIQAEEEASKMQLFFKFFSVWFEWDTLGLLITVPAYKTEP